MRPEFHFDEGAADKVCAFFERYLVHSKGEWAGKPFTLPDWQRRILRDVFGWKRGDGRRRYRRVYIEIARGNGKSTFGAGLALYLLAADGEAGADVVSAAGSAGQASLVYDEARRMAQASPRLSRWVEPYRNTLTVKKTQSTYRVVSTENAGNKLGLNLHGCIFDEFLTQRTRELHDTLFTSTIKRRNPLFVYLTTAGWDQDSICYETHLHAEKVAADPELDTEFYPALFCAGADDPIDQEATWRKANPNLGTAIKLDDFERAAQRAKTEPSFENTFRTLHLCQWQQQATRWINLDSWDRCTRPIDPADYTGQPAYVGMDLSQSFDLTALVTVWPRPEGWVVFPRLYIPKDTAERRQRDDGIPYLDWIKAGWVIEAEPVAGRTATINYAQIQRDLLDVCKANRVEEVCYDQHNANSLVNVLESAGVVTVPVKQGYYLSPACKEFERRLVNGQIILDANPALRHQAAAIEIEANHNGDIRPVKPTSTTGNRGGRSKYSIDGLVATLIATSRAMLRPDTEHTGENEFKVYVL